MTSPALSHGMTTGAIRGVPDAVRAAEYHFCMRSVPSTIGIASAATKYPVVFGGACPSSRAKNGMYRNAASMAASHATAVTRYRFDSQPSCHGANLELRHANAFAICPATTAVKAAPEAMSNGGPA